MNSKTKYVIPAVVAVVFALMLVVAVPSTMAERGEGGDHAKWKDGEYHKKGHHNGYKAIPVEGFTGSITIPTEMTKDTHAELKSLVTVSLGKAVSIAESNGVTDAIKASIGIAKEGDTKYLVWTVFSMNKDPESDVITWNTFVVDAGDSTNFTTVTKTFDHSKMNSYKTEKFEKLQEKFVVPSGDVDIDAAKAQFADLLQQLRDAYKNQDYETAKSIKEQLEELKQTVFLNMKSPRF